MGRETVDDSASCTQCGCPAQIDALYCAFCGSALSSYSERAPDTELPPTFAAYPPDQPPSAVPQDPKSRSRAPRSTRAKEPPSSQVADPLIGTVVADRYRIESQLGRGGMGVVYKVEHTKIGKSMALKLLTGELSRNKETVQRFKREALLVSRLSHPNTVQVFDYGSSGGLTYLAMEYLNGRDLGSLIEAEGPRPFQQMAKIVIQACGALQEAHDKGLVHRDIKPENIFLTRTPSGEELVKVLDFGLAKLRESKEQNAITSSGNIVGTPYYMPPEQVKGEEVDGRGDVYAMCALLYTAITGYHLFDAPSPVAVLTQQVSAAPIPPHHRAPDLTIPLSVSNIILKGLQKDPKHRYQTISELEDALRGELQATSFTRLSLPSSARFAPLSVEDEAATRDEVERYERSLRRREKVARSLFVLAGLGLVGTTIHLYTASQRPARFNGRETEPNHEVKTATTVPFGKPVLGQLGRRMSPTRGDQDSYQVLVPGRQTEERALIELRLSELPNMALCAWIFEQNQATPLFRYCGGEPGRGLLVPRLALRPGAFLIVIQQDRGSYWEGQNTLLHENVSDDYELLLRESTGASDFEVEPNNDRAAVRSPGFPQHTLGRETSAPVVGQLNIMRDVDVVCATGNGHGRWIVTDAKDGARPLHSVLEVTPLGGPQDKIPVRLHAGRNVAASERDQPSPWRSKPVSLKSDPCIRLTLVPNPMAPTPHPVIPPASLHEWSVGFLSAPADETSETRTNP